MPRKARRAIILTIASSAFVLALPAGRITAACAPLPSARSSDGIRIMRTTEFVVWGTIDRAVPTDAHAAFSFFLDVRGYFQGAGPARIEVSDYGNGDVPADATTAGSALLPSRTFVDRFGGQDAIVFAYGEDAPYTDQYAVNGCTYTAYGDAATAAIRSAVRRTLGAPQPPMLSTTGPAGLETMALTALILLAAGVSLRAAGRAKTVALSLRPR
jgi:hypothetical protein